MSKLVGFEKESQEKKVYKLHEALYGLKQAPKAWNKKIGGILRETRFMKCVIEHGVYVKRSNNNELIILCLYVDDLLITCSCKKEIEDDCWCIKEDMLVRYSRDWDGALQHYINTSWTKTTIDNELKWGWHWSNLV